MADLCPEPRSTGDWYLLDGGLPVMAFSHPSMLWFVTFDDGPIPFHKVRDRLTLLARREDAGPIVLEAMRWCEAAGYVPDCSALEAAVRAAKERARG